MIDTVAVCSGGMDSTTLAYLAAGRGDKLLLVSFDYGQRHVRELGYAARTARRLSADHLIVDMSGLAGVLRSALTDPGADIPVGHYASETMRQTVVPNRNAIMSSIAVGVAVSENARRVLVGVHAGDHPIYPDCRPEWVEAFNVQAKLATAGHHRPGFEFAAPFITMTKAEICTLGDSLGVEWADTWSCYQGGEVHCGACGTCVERREAFDIAGVADPTEYEQTPVFDAP